MRNLLILLCLSAGLLGCTKKSSKPANDHAGADVSQAATPEGTTGEFNLEDFERDCRRHLSKLSYKHSEEWGIDKSARWDADLEQGIISWTFPDKVISAPVQVIGTYVPADQSLLWAWDHPSVDKKLAKDALKLKEWGEEHGVEDLTTREVHCSEAQVWTYVAMACKIAEANGAYRGPSGRAFIFFTFGKLSVSKPQITPQFDLEK